MLLVRALSRTAVGNSYNNSGIRCLRALWASEVRNGYRCKSPWLLAWIPYNSWLYLNMEAKIGLYIIFYKSVPEFHALHIKISLILSNFKLLNRGSACALYLQLVTSLIVRFCNLDNISHSNPQDIIANCKWDRIEEEYISLHAEKGKKRFRLFITTRVRYILLNILIH